MENKKILAIVVGVIVVTVIIIIGFSYSRQLSQTNQDKQSQLLQSQTVKDMSNGGVNPLGTNNPEDIVTNLVLPLSTVSSNIRSLWDPYSVPNYVLEYTFNPSPSTIQGFKLIQLGDSSKVHDIKQIDLYDNNPILNSSQTPLATFSPEMGTDKIQTFVFTGTYSKLYLQLKNNTTYEVAPQRLQFY